MPLRLLAGRKNLCWIAVNENVYTGRVNADVAGLDCAFCGLRVQHQLVNNKDPYGGHIVVTLDKIYLDHKVRIHKHCWEVDDFIIKLFQVIARYWQNHHPDRVISVEIMCHAIAGFK